MLLLLDGQQPAGYLQELTKATGFRPLSFSTGIELDQAFDDDNQSLLNDLHRISAKRQF